MLVALFGLALVITGAPRLFHRSRIPPEFAMCPDVNRVKWIRFYSCADTGTEFWRYPLRDPNVKGEAYVVSQNGHVLATFSGDDTSVTVYHKDRSIAWLPLRNRSYDEMREFFVPDTNGIISNLIDFDGDGIVDTKSAGDRFWIYRHGDFVEATVTSRYNRVQVLLDGTKVTFLQGKWINE